MFYEFMILKIRIFEATLTSTSFIGKLSFENIEQFRRSIVENLSNLILAQGLL